MRAKDVRLLALILAGGEGTRLQPLTRDRAKPAVPFGGRYRLIDFVLSNFVNSGYFQIKVLTQYKASSLITHLVRGWQLAPILGQFVEPVPAQMRVGRDWFRGSADAVFEVVEGVAVVLGEGLKDAGAIEIQVRGPLVAQGTRGHGPLADGEVGASFALAHASGPRGAGQGPGGGQRHRQGRHKTGHNTHGSIVPRGFHGGKGRPSAG